MKKILALALTAAIAFGCGKEPKDIPTWTPSTGEGATVSELDKYDPEEITYPSDMVLLYGQGHHRTPYKWDTDLMKIYVGTEVSGKPQWLFDGFLLLEFIDPNVNGGAGVKYCHGAGYKDASGKEVNDFPAASKEDWQNLINYYFEPGTNLDAIEYAIKSYADKIGEPKTKRKVIFSIPEPITNLYPEKNSGPTDYWGSINGRKLDFLLRYDKIEAVKWFIDECRRQFAEKNYKYLELTGFYCLLEKSTYFGDIIPDIAKYLKSHNYSYNWIPYNRAQGAEQWKSFGFSKAYLQPNYAVYENYGKDRLIEACENAVRLGMDVEMEFDGRELKTGGYMERLQEYMQAFKDYGFWQKGHIAYYQSAWTVKQMKESRYEEDKQQYKDLCEFITSRPTRND